MTKITAIIVTFNRKKLLTNCIFSLLKQPLNKIIIIDNTSIDGTETQLIETGIIANHLVEYYRLPENIGGSGGFSTGLKLAYEKSYDWFWLMDDDALPAPNALKQLIQQANNNLTIYGSIALHQEQLCWPIIYQHRAVSHLIDLPELISVGGIPFLGFFIHRELINLIGFPDDRFFISGDDIEYCQRAKRLGHSIVMVKNSHIYHPMPPRITINLWTRKFFLLIQPPWRRYYDIRNRIVIARRYYGLKLYTATLPGIIFRWFLTLCFEENRWLQSKAYFEGIKDGLLNRLGKVKRY